MPDAPAPRVLTPLEAVDVDPSSYDTASMARGEPGIPRRFRWRGETFEIAEILDGARETGACHHGSGERYVRRHVSRARTTDGAIVTLSGERASRGPRWILRSIERP